METVTDAVFKDRTNSCWWKLIRWLAETIFLQCLRYFSRSPSSRLVGMYFSVQKKYCFSFRAFFPASGNHYLNYRVAYLKLLLVLLVAIFFDFSDIPVIGSSFSLIRNVFLNKFSIPAGGNRFAA